MTRLLDAADRCLQACGWRDLALVKFCVCAVGVLMGIMIPARRKRVTAWVASLVFVAAYVPLMMKFLPFLSRRPIEDIYD